jgi:rhamnosyl/mannosyltransferase
MQQEWQALSDELGLTNRVTFAGEVVDADLPGYYRQVDLFVLPANARAEAFGMVLLEAMASGLPCITTELGTGTSWVVQDGVTGFVVPPKNPSVLAESINKLIADESLRQQFGQAALARTRAEFSQEVMVKRVMQVYETVLEEQAKRI